MQFVLIDFENVQPDNLDGLKKGLHHIRVFVGESQSKISLGTAKALQSFGSDADYIQIVGSGSNALDFHLAFYLGRLSLQHPQASFVIVSKDTGFDPLVKHLNRLGTACRRVASIATAVGATPKAAPASAAAHSPPEAALADTTVDAAAHPAAIRVTVETLAAQESATAAAPGAQRPPSAGAPPPTSAKVPAPAAKPAAQKATAPKAAIRTTAASATKPAPKSAAKATAKVAAAPSDVMIQAILDRLRGMKSARPRTLKTLTSSITSWHKLDAPRTAAVLKALVDGGHVTIDGKKLAYHFG
jgi:hypothetical protein